MIIHDVQQGSDAWHELRLGIPTGSEFSRIVTNTRGELSESRHKLMAELLVERFTGAPMERFTSAAMERGSGLEEQAVRYYEAVRGLDAFKVGFCTNDTKTIGVSPDRFLGERELLEVKCPERNTHMTYLMASLDRAKRKSVATEYRAQVQGQLWITGRDKCVTLSYCPGLPEAIIEAERDEEYIAKLAAGVEQFSIELELWWSRLQELLPATLADPDAKTGAGFLTADDIEWAHKYAENL